MEICFHVQNRKLNFIIRSPETVVDIFSSQTEFRIPLDSPPHKQLGSSDLRPFISHSVKHSIAKLSFGLCAWWTKLELNGLIPKALQHKDYCSVLERASHLALSLYQFRWNVQYFWGTGPWTLLNWHPMLDFSFCEALHLHFDTLKFVYLNYNQHTRSW